MSYRLAEIPVEQIVARDAAGKPAPRLVESMRQYGLFRPILVRAREDGRYDLGTGGASLAAARALRWRTIPALVSAAGATAPSAERAALLVHAQRESLQALHVGRWASRLLGQHEGTQTELAEEIGIDQSTLSRMVRVAECEELDAAVAEDGLAFGAARELVALPPGERLALLAELRQSAARDGKYPTVREIEARVRQRQGRAPRVEIAPKGLAAALPELQAQGFQIEIRPLRGRKGGSGSKQITLLVAAADAAAVRRCLAPDRPAAAAAGKAAERQPVRNPPRRDAPCQRKRAA